jgi:hypothetical protein
MVRALKFSDRKPTGLEDTLCISYRDIKADSAEEDKS